MSKIVIYCDGACLGNPGPGGYAALLIHKNERITERVVAGFELSSTNNRMELRAAIEGLKALTRPCELNLFSDSQYLIKGMNEWIHGWLAKNFKGSNNKAVANQDLWQELFLLSKKHKITWLWVKGHAGNEFNERVDEIAKEQALLAQHQFHKKLEN